MRWETLGESVAGTSHRTRGVPCQDAFRYGSFGEWLVVVVADGAGSASLSERGAMLACDVILRDAAVGPVGRLLSLDGMRQQIEVVRGTLADEAAGAGISVREMACTLLVAVAGPDRAAFAQVGDGAIVVRVVDGGHDVVFWPEPSEYVNATSFVTDDVIDSSLQFRIVEGSVQELAVLTDGLQRLALDFDRRGRQVYGAGDRQAHEQ